MLLMDVIHGCETFKTHEREFCFVITSIDRSIAASHGKKKQTQRKAKKGELVWSMVFKVNTVHTMAWRRCSAAQLSRLEVISSSHIYYCIVYSI